MERRNKSFVVDRALKLSNQLLISSEQGMIKATDDGCVTLCGLFRDYAHKLKIQAEMEKQQHGRVRVS